METKKRSHPISVNNDYSDGNSTNSSNLHNKKQKRNNVLRRTQSYFKVQQKITYKN